MQPAGQSYERFGGALGEVFPNTSENVAKSTRLIARHPRADEIIAVAAATPNPEH